MSAPDLTIADVLERAADLIEPEGAWMQGDFGNAIDIQTSSCFCIEGAVAKVLGWHDCMRAERWCDEHFTPDGMNAARWNDDFCHSGSEAAAKLREAAALARTPSPAPSLARDAATTPADVSSETLGRVSEKDSHHG